MKQNIRMTVPERVAPGTLADIVTVNHNDEYFILDFAAVTAAESASEDSVNIDAQVAARVKLLPSRVFELMRCLELHLTQWEVRTGVREAPVDVEELGAEQPRT